jgi:glycosyltransferase involved in cell wall biosynthesis
VRFAKGEKRTDAGTLAKRRPPPENQEPSVKIHCITLTKNEEDIVGHCLTEAAKWADHIYVYDGLSTDSTWDIVKSLQSEKITAWKQDGKVFSEGLRAEVFNEFRHLSTDGDWWLALDADEFFINPREILSRIPRLHDLVWAIPIQYYLTSEDLATIDFSLPIEQRLPLLRHYDVTWSEPRAFRYRERLVWKTEWALPRHAGIVAKQRILFKHYQYRSPEQIQKRLDTRRDNRDRGYWGWAHASQASWKEKIVDGSQCNFDDGSGRYVFDEQALPKHTEPTAKRLIKSVLHRTGIWP